jgi:hypothetical protein
VKGDKAAAGEPRFVLEELSWFKDKKWPKNPKSHDLGFLGEAFKENGLAEFPTFDEGTGRMVAGHGRVKKLEAMHAAGEQPPERVVVRGGKWLVPVIRGMTFAAPGKHLLASNRGVELGGYDIKLLLASIKAQGDDLGGTGYVADDVARLAALARDQWSSDIDVRGAGEHMEAIPGRVLVTCKPRDTKAIRELVDSTLKRKGFRGVEVS